MLTDQDILHRYHAKQAEFTKQADITLIGHSLFDMWGDLPNGTPHLARKTVANLGISGVSARQYLDVIAKPGRITRLGSDVFLFLGVNDIVKEPDYSPQQALDWIMQIVRYCRHIAPHTRYALLEATPVNQIDTVTNAQILAMNAYFKQHCPPDIAFIPTWDQFKNAHNELDLALCHDGLHFTPAGYAVLQGILESHL